MISITSNLIINNFEKFIYYKIYISNHIEKFISYDIYNK